MIITMVYVGPEFDLCISSKAVNHEAAGGLSIVAVSVGRKKSRFLCL